jgi:hypothetical protein
MLKYSTLQMETDHSQAMLGSEVKLPVSTAAIDQVFLLLQQKEDQLVLHQLGLKPL